MLDIIIAIIFFLIGISVGSFLNVVADRVPLGKSIVSPPSHCFHCGHKLESRDLIPIVSYWWLKGKCRYCGATIPVRSIVVELCTGLIFVLAVINMELGWELAGALIYIAILIILSITDVELGIIPHKIVYPGIGIVFIIKLINTLIAMQPNIIITSLIGLSIAAVFFSLLWGIPQLFKKKIMGFGDVGMAGLVGLSVGFPLVVIAMYLAILIGGLTMITLIVIKQKKSSDKVSFGLYLAVGGIGTILWSKELSTITTFFLS